MNKDNPGTPFLEVKELEFSYGEVKVLHGLDFQINEKTIACVMGRNGVGKTTLMRNLVGLEKPSAGSIFFKGKEITNTEGYSRALSGFGYVPQGRQIFPLLTVEENLSVALSAAGLDQQVIPPSVYDTFPVLYDMRKRRGGDLSGGQQQRIAVARALVAEPSLILADEPTGNLDSSNGEEVMQLLTELNNKGTTIVMVTHSPEFAACAKRQITLRDGKYVSN